MGQTYRSGRCEQCGGLLVLVVGRRHAAGIEEILVLANAARGSLKVHGRDACDERRGEGTQAVSLSH